MIYLFCSQKTKNISGGKVLELRELGLNYLLTAVRLRQKVNGLKLQLNSLEGIEYTVMKRRISCFNEDIKNCTETGRYLTNYYRKG